jgi:hypothetical protein
MNRTRLSLYYLGSYLVIIGLGLLLEPRATMRIFNPTATTATCFRASPAC